VKVKEGDLTTDRSIFEFVQDYLNRESRQDQSAEQPNRNGFSPLRSKASFLPEPKTDDSAEADQTDWSSPPLFARLSSQRLLVRWKSTERKLVLG
jgi:hypothetical protein